MIAVIRRKQNNRFYKYMNNNLSFENWIMIPVEVFEKGSDVEKFNESERNWAKKNIRWILNDKGTLGLGKERRRMCGPKAGEK